MPHPRPVQPHRGWTRHPAIATLLEGSVARFATVYPWSAMVPPIDSETRLQLCLLTAAEVLALDLRLPRLAQCAPGHNDAPSWHACVRLATAHPDLLLAGFLRPPSRADEGIAIDAVYLPLPDSGQAGYLQAITRDDGRPYPPDEDGVEMLMGRQYRRLWWD